MGSGPASSWGPGEGDVVIALYSFPHHLHPGAYACSHPLLTCVPLTRLHAHTYSLTAAHLPCLFVSLLAHRHCGSLTNSITQAGARTHTCLLGTFTPASA